MKRCIVCRSEDVLRGMDYCWCVRCGTVTTDYQFDAKIYDQAYAQHYADLSGTPIERQLNASRLAIFHRWVKTGGRLVDFGCSVGDFLALARGHYQCTGLDCNTYALSIALKKLNGAVHLDSYLDHHRGFDGATFFDVLEHLPDPTGTLIEVKSRLNSQGIIVVIFPNISAVPFGDHDALKVWKHFKPREHLCLFSVKGLRLMAEKAGFEIMQISNEESTIRPGNLHDDIMTVVLRAYK